MKSEYIKIQPNLICKSSILDILPQINTIVFDIDGVLIDVSSSFRKAIGKTTDFYFSNILSWKNSKNIIYPSEVEKFKMAGGFNDDWDLSFAVVLFYLYKGVNYQHFDISKLKKMLPTLDDFLERITDLGGGLSSAEKIIFEEAGPQEATQILSWWDKKIIKRIFQEIYAGEKEVEKVYNGKPLFIKMPGLYLKEKVLIDTKLLNKRFSYGIITGRTEGEMYLALRKMRGEKKFKKDFIITQDDGIRKPDPACLKKIVKNKDLGIYVGDIIDDLLLVENYKKATNKIFLSCIVDFKNKKFYQEKNADIIVDKVNTLLLFLQKKIH